MKMSARATAKTNTRFHATDTGPTTSGAAGKGLLMLTATPLQASCSAFCSAIQAPIMTSMVVSMSAARSRLRSTSSSSAPSSTPSTIARPSATKKLAPVSITSRYIMYAPNAYSSPWVKLTTFMMPKISVSPMPSSAYVPPSISALRQCWRNWSIDPTMGPRLRGGDEARCLVLDHLAVVDAHHVDAGHVLRAFLAGGSLLDEADIAVDALDLDLPQRLGDRLRLGLAGDLDRLDHRIDRVPAAEALGEAADVVLARVPFADELLRDVRVL